MQATLMLQLQTTYDLEISECESLDIDNVEIPTLFKVMTGERAHDTLQQVNLYPFL